MEEPLELPPKPPQSRKWRGSTVAPFAGNNMLVLHSCPENCESKYFVQVLHSEQPVPMTVYLAISPAYYAYDFLCFHDMNLYKIFRY